MNRLVGVYCSSSIVSESRSNESLMRLLPTALPTASVAAAYLRNTPGAVGGPVGISLKYETRGLGSFNRNESYLLKETG